MIINEKNNRIFCIKGKMFYIGCHVFCMCGYYRGLYGTVIEYRTGEDKDTDNEYDDIYVCFERPQSPDDIKIIEDRFSKLYCRKMTIDEIALDEVIMDPEELISFL